MDHIVKTVGLILSVAFQGAKLTEKPSFYRLILPRVS